MKKHYYIGRREFVEIFDAYGNVIDRSITLYNFGQWLRSDPVGLIVFKSRQGATWETLSAGYNEDGNVICDYAPPGFDGTYSLINEARYPIEDGVYFATVDDVIFAKQDFDYYVNLEGLEPVVHRNVGCDLQSYFRRMGRPSPYCGKLHEIKGLAEHKFAKLSTVEPLFRDCGLTHLRTEHLRNGSGYMKQKTLPELSHIASKVKALNKSRRKPDPYIIKARAVLDPRNFDRFKVFLYTRTEDDGELPSPANSTLHWCAEGHFDHEEHIGVIKGYNYRGLLTRRCRHANVSIERVSSLYRDVYPFLEYVDYNTCRGFYSHKIGHNGTQAARMYSCQNKIYVNLFDWLRVCRVEKLRNAQSLLANEAINQNKLEEHDLNQLYNTSLEQIKPYSRKVLFLDDLRIPLSLAMNFYNYMAGEHELSRTKVFHKGDPPAVRAIKHSIIISEDYYDSLLPLFE